MQFALETAELFIPDGMPEIDALARTTHMAIGAHQDDLEIMAYHGILECFQKPEAWYTGVVVTNGAGSPRAGVYEQYTDDEMCVVRVKEQKKAAVIGEYAAQALLDYPSSAVKDASNTRPVDDLVQLLKAAKPRVVYTHNLADKHDTHVGVALKVIAAIRKLDAPERPELVLGCEVWRDLDWLLDSDKVLLDVSAHENLQAALLGVFDSQIAGGKRYDLAIQGRRRANATFLASHGVDETTGTTFAMDLTPLTHDPKLPIATFIDERLNRFQTDVADRFKRLGI